MNSVSGSNQMSNYSGTIGCSAIAGLGVLAIDKVVSNEMTVRAIKKDGFEGATKVVKNIKSSNRIGWIFAVVAGAVAGLSRYVYNKVSNSE